MSNFTRKIKRQKGKAMNNKPVIPMPVQGIGDKQQLPFDIKDAIGKACECGNETFDIAYRIKTISKMAPSNRAGKNIVLKFDIYICRGCGKEITDPNEL